MIQGKNQYRFPFIMTIRIPKYKFLQFKGLLDSSWRSIRPKNTIMRRMVRAITNNLCLLCSNPYISYFITRKKELHPPLQSLLIL